MAENMSKASNRQNAVERAIRHHILHPYGPTQLELARRQKTREKHEKAIKKLDKEKVSLRQKQTSLKQELAMLQVVLDRMDTR